MATVHSMNLAANPIPGATPAIVTIMESSNASAPEFMNKTQILQQLIPALKAFEEKKALDACVLQMDLSSGAFTDYMLIASGSNPRQVQAIADAVEENLKKAGDRANHVEGYNQAEWIMLDYVDFVVSIFSERARRYYDLERLWKSANKMTVEEVMAAARPKPKAKAKARAATLVEKPAKAPAKAAKVTARKSPPAKPKAAKAAAKPRARKPRES